LEHLDPERLPVHGGDATTVMVTITLDSLRQDLATAGLLDGDLTAGANLSATQARRLACNAQIIPVVLGGKGEILDLGRTRRLYNAAQRKALRLRDKRCRAEGCSIPATWCEAHHETPWSRGGRTDLDDGVLLCSWHHHRAHDRRFHADKLPNGDIRFHRRR
ncbi:HNH endonuclease signature motif containing protein, partial [Nocardioides antri]